MASWIICELNEKAQRERKYEKVKVEDETFYFHSNVME